MPEDDKRAVRIPEATWREIKAAAALRGLSLGQYIIAAHHALQEKPQ